MFRQEVTENSYTKREEQTSFMLFNNKSVKSILCIMPKTYFYELTMRVVFLTNNVTKCTRFIKIVLGDLKAC